MKDKYILGSEGDFHNFINLISKKDKIGLVTHIDVDGIASAVFLQKILESRDLKIEFIEFLNYQADILKNILNKKFDILFFTDWSVDSYLEDLKQLRKKGKIFVVDHHPINDKLKDKSNFIKTDSAYCSSHCLFDMAESGNYFNIKDLEWLVCASIIMDYTWDKSEGNFDFIKKIYPNVKKDATIWKSEPGKIGNLINGALIYYQPDFRKVYDLVLKKDLEKLEKANEIIGMEVNNWIEKTKKEAEYFPEKKLLFNYANPKYNITSTIASILSDRDFKGDTVIFASDFSDKKGFVKVSARNQMGNVDLGQLLKKCVEGFENSSAGGHKKAAAGTFSKKYLNEFKERLLRELK